MAATPNAPGSSAVTSQKCPRRSLRPSRLQPSDRGTQLTWSCERRHVPGARANDQTGVWQLTLQLLSRRQGRTGVIVTPHQLDRTPHRRDRRSVILRKRANEHIPHDAGSSTIVVRAVALSHPFHSLLTDYPPRAASPRAALKRSRGFEATPGGR